jgi:adenine-specific DNA-methyltransferase
MPKKTNKRDAGTPQQSSAYTHEQQAVQRPDVGIQPEFDARRPATDYRYDSSLAPELCWDENAEQVIDERGNELMVVREAEA